MKSEAEVLALVDESYESLRRLYNELAVNDKVNPFVRIQWRWRLAHAITELNFIPRARGDVLGED